MWSPGLIAVRLALVAIFACSFFLRMAYADNYPERRATLLPTKLMIFSDTHSTTDKLSLILESVLYSIGNTERLISLI